MESISELRDRILDVYGRVETYVTPVLKFILVLISLIFINSNLGFMSKITNIVIVLAVSLICAFLPLSVAVVISAMFIMLHIYSLSMQAAIIVALVFVVMLALYFRFTPKEAILVMLTPIFLAIKIPYALALAAGFVCGPLAFVPIGCGTVVYYIVTYIGNNSDKFGGSFSAENALSGFKAIIDNVLNNDTMIVMVITLAVVVVLANVIKRLSFDYSWYVALGISAISGLIVVIIGSSAMDADISIVGSIISMLVSTILVFVMQLFVHNVDYSRAEYVDFEDEEYYYYVKAIPRLTVAESYNRNQRRRR